MALRWLCALLLALPGAWGDCPQPPRFAFAEPAAPQEGSYAVGTALLYRCRPGYARAEGKSAEVTCGPDSLWSAEPDFCIGKSCGPPDIANGNFDYTTDLLFGATITYTCNVGYRLVGEPSAQCVLEDNEVSWDNIPHCVSIPCSSPPVVENGQLIGGDRDFTFGMAVTYSCEKGFALIGNATIHCKMDDNLEGIWSGPAPECKVVRCKNPEVKNGRRLSGFGTEHTYKNTVTFECNPGHLLNGSNVVTCEADNTWKPPLPTCDPKKSCGPPDIANGNFDYTTDLLFGATITYTCNVGYRLVGEPSAQCVLKDNEVSWDNIPHCVSIPCSSPPVVENGQLIGGDRDFTFGMAVTYSCEKGFALIGNATIHCKMDGNLEGIWSGPAPECKGKCFLFLLILLTLFLIPLPICTFPSTGEG